MVVAKLSVKLITQYVEITLGSEIVFYGRFHLSIEPAVKDYPTTCQKNPKSHPVREFF